MTPTKPGFYWAKWMIADDHLPDDTRPYQDWEPVEVFIKDLDPEELRAQIIGHEFSQSLDCFHWGEQLPAPIDKTAAIRRQTEVQKQKDAVKRFREMSLAERIEKGSKRR